MQASACFHFKLLSSLIVYSIIESSLSQVIEPPVEVNETLFVPRVVNGYAANLGDVPYQVGFKSLKSRIRRLYESFCGGAIIAPTTVLSAAHCFEVKQSACFAKSIVVSKNKLTRKLAVAGSLINVERYRLDSTDGGQWRRLKAVVYPAKYKFPKHDICIVIITQPFSFNAYVAPIPFASRFVDYKGECLVSGYGRLSSAFSKYKIRSERLMLAKLAVFPAYYCSRRHRKNMRHFICTSDQISDTAQGDSGGPLVCSNTNDPQDMGKGVVVGIVSGSRRGAGSFFTRVSSYYKYINKNKSNSVSVPSHFWLFITIYYGLYLFCLRFIWCIFLHYMCIGF